MITAIRKHARSWVIKVLLVIVMLSFVLSFSIGRFEAEQLVLARVGEHEILINDYNREYARELDTLRERFGADAENIAVQFNTRKRVFDRMVNQELILAAAQGEGLLVTAEEVMDAIVAQPYFQHDQHFDFTLYQNVLAQNGLTPETYEQRLRRELQVRKYQRHLLAGLVVGAEEVTQRYRIENETVEVETFLMPPEIFKDAIQSDAAAEKAYYDAHKKAFMQPEQFKVSYFVLPLDKVQTKVHLKARALQRYYERHLDTRFSTPKRVRARHILKKLSAEATPQQVSKVQTALSKLRTELEKGAAFADLAQKHSEDFTRDKGGELGFFTHEDMLPAFADAAFALAPGELSGVVRTAFGMHLIQVVEVKESQVKPFAEVQAEIEGILRSQRAERRLTLEAERFAQRLGTETIQTVAAEWEQPVHTSPWIDSSAVLKQLGATRNFYALLKGGKEEDAGVWQRNPVQGYVFYRILERKAAYQKPQEAVQAELALKVVAERMTEAAVQEAKKVYKRIDNYAAFKAAAQNRKLPIISTTLTAITSDIPKIGLNREFLKTALRLTPAKPLGLGIDGRSVHLLYLKKRQLPPEENEQERKAKLRERIRGQWEQYFLQAQLERLKQEIDIQVLAPELIAAQ